MDDQNKNLILATALSFLVILAWFVGGPMLFPQWFPEEPAAEQTATPETAAPATTAEAPADATATAAAAQPAPEAPRLTIDTPKLSGSLSLTGGRIDDLSLKTYRETKDPGSAEVRLLSPVGKDHPYYAVFGWLAGNGLDPADVPDAKTQWSVTAGTVLASGQPVTLQWQNTKGLTFTRTLAVDEDFMFTVTDKVENKGTAEARLAPYGIVARHGLPKLQGTYVVHEGLIRRTDGTFGEVKYSKFADFDLAEGETLPAEKVDATTDGWIGFSDHYWMTTLVPEQGKPWKSVARYVPQNDIYQAEVHHDVMAVAPGASAEVTTQLYAGAKEWDTIRAYQNEAGIAGFIDSIDWGWFYFFTKPIFWLLHQLHGLIGNMGLAIMALTLVLKVLVLPLAYKSYVSMARMKELQPEMEALKERAGEDKQKLQKEMMQLYKDKKVNPAAGCLPILIQIPIFYALFKVISNTLELRHAAFFGWLDDLSGPDSSSLYNIFGLMPWDAPAAGTLTHMIFIGIVPIILGITMWLQQKLNPAPADPVQQQIFAWMPWVFMFMMSTFASGLIIYWITNNTITFVQQYLIMASHGHRPDIFGNIKASVKKPVVVADKSRKK
ncbi:membrane protein insertase YidC [Tabrizicola oligotrophica]|uniref:Membrane protein insertase YidC n=1 Tax=Tabrizicola oligotrophica TaxID=2710650 RepID=A0A6M0QUZ7_9RHOB|nr:membrane protein insertase YidC [Tabrizicola oligotrophica]NEY91237.1 membrane protein insertase YidC [Tabrizicola oligotrophica]